MRKSRHSRNCRQDFFLKLWRASALEFQPQLPSQLADRFYERPDASPTCLDRASRSRVSRGYAAEADHKEPVVVRKTRQLDTQKPPVRERNVTPAEVTPRAAERQPEGMGTEPDAKCNRPGSIL